MFHSPSTHIERRSRPQDLSSIVFKLRSDLVSIYADLLHGCSQVLTYTTTCMSNSKETFGKQARGRPIFQMCASKDCGVPLRQSSLRIDCGRCGKVQINSLRTSLINFPLRQRCIKSRGTVSTRCLSLEVLSLASPHMSTSCLHILVDIDMLLELHTLDLVWSHHYSAEYLCRCEKLYLGREVIYRQARQPRACRLRRPSWR